MVEMNEPPVDGRRSNRIAVIGAGYVGVPTALVLASFGYSVVVAERDETRRMLLSAGSSPLLEEGLEDVLSKALDDEKISFCASAAEAVAGARFVFLCVATPTGEMGRADLRDLEAAIEQIAPHLRDDAIVINKSTVPVGTTAHVASLLQRPSIAVVSNPEFLREGKAVPDSFRPYRVVVGSSDRSAAQAVADLFHRTGAPVVVTDAVTAELTKYVANAFLALKLSFVNSVSELCDATGADISDLVAGIGLDPRIGQTHLSPGPGWGGSCLPKDVAELLGLTHALGVKLPILEATYESNLSHQDYIVSRTLDITEREPSAARVAGLGLTFKANTGDRRDSPAIAILHRLVERGVSVAAFDPTVPIGTMDADLQGLTLQESALESAQGADIVLVLTEWPEFSLLDWDVIGRNMRSRRVLDTRDVIDIEAARRAGFDVHQVGRRPLTR